MFMEKGIYSRNYEVNYYEVEEHIWRSVSHLKDHQHDIVVTADISVPDMIILVPDMIILDADVDFIKAPVKQCLLMKELIGVNIFQNLKLKPIIYFLAKWAVLTLECFLEFLYLRLFIPISLIK